MCAAPEEIDRRRVRRCTVSLCRRLMTLLVVLVGARASHAQMHLLTPDVRVEARYDVVEEGALAQRIQGALRVNGGVALGETFSLVAFLASGDDFASRWATLYDARTGRAVPGGEGVRLRRLYGQWSRPRYRMQLGAIPPVKAVVSPTGLDPAGWIDGARLEWYLPAEGTVEAVVGRLGEIETPSVFARPFLFTQPLRANYAEIEVSQPLSANLRAEASVEYLHAPYLRSELRWASGKGTPEVIGEVLYNAADRAVSVGTTVHLDPLAALGQHHRVTFTLRHAYKDEAIGLRGRLADEFVTFGHSLTAVAEVVLSERYGLDAEVEAIVSEGVGVEGLEGDRYTRFKVVVGWRWP